MVLSEFSLEGKTAIITGASRGIGQAISLTFAEAGADIVAAARTAADLEETAAGVRRLGRECLVVPTDVTSMEQVEDMVAQTIAKFGKIDILVNNAGYSVESPVVVTGQETTGLIPGLKLNYAEPYSEESWRMLVDVNLSAAFRCSRAVGPHMVKQKSGKIISISSFCSVISGIYDIPYAAAKQGINQLTRVLALELGPHHINVNAIGPGSNVTAIRWLCRPHLTREQVDEVLERIPEILPLRRHGELREMGLLAVYLASPASDYMTGQVIYLDGGMVAR
jgi:NAD(P)-dependent dehydrogenase (short-subunit alcohol dehydrogenase family)